MKHKSKMPWVDKIFYNNIKIKFQVKLKNFMSTNNNNIRNNKIKYNNNNIYKNSYSKSNYFNNKVYTIITITTIMDNITSFSKCKTRIILIIYQITSNIIII